MRWLFDLAWVALVVFVAASSSMLPEMVVSHPGATIPRASYMAVTLAMAIILPWLSTRGATLLARHYPLLVHFPNKNYWLAPERREATITWFGRHSFSLGLLVVGMLAMTQWMTLQRALPIWPHVPLTLWMLVHSSFFIGLALWLIPLYRRFGKTP